MPNFPERNPSRWFEVNTREVIEAVNWFDGQIPTTTIREIAREGVFRAKEMLLDEFEAAFAIQDTKAFPESFQNHIRRVVSKLPIVYDLVDNAVSIDMKFDLLGNSSDLKRAFHQGAILKAGGRVNGPWDESMVLLEEDASVRHLFWEAMVRGESHYTPGRRRNKKGQFRKQTPVPIPIDAWEKTQEKYIDIWGEEKAPEWLYLQYGQSQWEPHINPSSIVENFTAKFGREFDRIFKTKLTEAMLLDQRQQNQYGPTFQISKNLNRYYAVRGGNPANKGQFSKRNVRSMRSNYKGKRS